MKKGDTLYAPSFARGHAMWRVTVRGHGKHGTTVVRWEEGPLKGREARLVSKSLRRAR